METRLDNTSYDIMAECSHVINGNISSNLTKQKLNISYCLQILTKYSKHDTQSEDHDYDNKVIEIALYMTTTIAVPAIILNVLVLVVICKYCNKKNPHYLLIISQLVVDIILSVV